MRSCCSTQDQVAPDPRGVKRKLPDDDGDGSEPEFHFLSDQEENNSDEEKVWSLLFGISKMKTAYMMRINLFNYYCISK